MSTYSTIRKATGSNHPLDGRYGGYCQGLVPQILWATGYGPATWTRPDSPSSQTTEVRYPALGTALPLLTKKHEGHLSKEDPWDVGPRDLGSS
jgi:hypothetical protein